MRPRARTRRRETRRKRGWRWAAGAWRLILALHSAPASAAAAAAMHLRRCTAGLFRAAPRGVSVAAARPRENEAVKCLSPVVTHQLCHALLSRSRRCRRRRRSLRKCARWPSRDCFPSSGRLRLLASGLPAAPLPSPFVLHLRASTPVQVKRNRLRKVNQSPPAAKAKPAPAREQRPSPRRVRCRRPPSSRARYPLGPPRRLPERRFRPCALLLPPLLTPAGQMSPTPAGRAHPGPGGPRQRGAQVRPQHRPRRVRPLRPHPGPARPGAHRGRRRGVRRPGHAQGPHHARRHGHDGPLRVPGQLRGVHGVPRAAEARAQGEKAAEAVRARP